MGSGYCLRKKLGDPATAFQKYRASLWWCKLTGLERGIPMFELVSTRLKCVGLSIACITVAVCVLRPSLLAQPHPGLIASAQQPSSSSMTQAAPSDQACQRRVNDTPEKLLECIQPSALWNY